MDHRDLHPAPWRVDTHSTRGGLVHAIVDSLARRVMVADSAADAERIVESVNMACTDDAHALELARWQDAAEAWREDASKARARLGAENVQLGEIIDKLREYEVSAGTRDLLHRLASAKRQMDRTPEHGVTSRAIVREHYGQTVRRLADALITEGYGQ